MMSDRPTYEGLRTRVRQLEEQNREYADRVRHFSTLYEKMVEGVCLHEVLRSKSGTVYDYRILDVNPAYERIIGFRKEDAVGKMASELYDSVPPPYLDLYARVAESGEPTSFETYYRPLDRFFAISVFSPEPEQFATIFFDISDRRMVEEELAQIFAMSLDMIAVFDMEREVFLKINPAFTTILGYPEAELLEKPFWELIHPDDVDETARVIKEKLSKGQKVINFENRHRCRDGSYRWLNWVSHPLVDKGICFAVAHDTTERKMAEKALAESEGRFRRLMENAKDMVYRMSLPDGRYEYVSPAAVQVMGYDPEEFYASPVLIRQIIHPEFENYFRREWQALLAGDMPPTYQYKIIHKDGRTRWLRQSNFLVTDDEGRATAIEGIVTDISELKQVETALQESESLLNEVGRIAKIGGWEMDLVTRQAKWTEATYHIVEMEQGEKIPGPDEHISYYLPEFRPMVAEAMRALIEDDIPLEFEAQMRSAKGTVKWCRALGRATRRDGKCIRVSGTFQDITERKVAEEERELMELKLRQSQKMEAVGTLAGGIAHDFNNIISIILGNSELALDDIYSLGTVQESLTEIRTACLRARDVVQHLLNFSRKTARKRRPVELGGLVRETMGLMRASIPTFIEIRPEIPDNLPAVMADPTQIHQVLINLCTNASHAMADGGRLTIAVSSVQVTDEHFARYHNIAMGPYLELAVSDTGSGIDPAIRDKIFDPYFTTKAMGRGTGMGLAVVHGIVKSNEGAVYVDSPVDSGATIRVLLPVTRELPEDEQGMAGRPARGHERILFVDDESPLVKVGQLMLERLGYQVKACTDPLEALAHFKKHPDRFDLLITDMTMPGMTGDKLIQKIREIRPAIPILLCTGYSDRIDAGLVHALGNCLYLEKPLMREELTRAVREVLDAA